MRRSADELLHLPLLQVHDGERHPAVGDRGRDMGAVRADRGRHDLAAGDDEALADRVDVLVIGHDQALAGGLADPVGAELVRLGERDTGTGDDDSRGACGDEGYPAADASTTGMVLLDTPTAACYLH